MGHLQGVPLQKIPFPSHGDHLTPKEVGAGPALALERPRPKNVLGQGPFRLPWRALNGATPNQNTL